MYEEANNPNSKMIECDCFDREHIIYIDLDHEDRDITFTKKYISYLPWYKRIIKAVQYVFKCEPEYMWDTTVINDKEQAQKLLEMSQTLLSTFKS
jgi:hypothetical protein